MPALHYIYDPLCGWCYAVAPLVKALVQSDVEVELHLHAGGLFERFTPPASMRHGIRSADGRIAALSGQEFGEPYVGWLLYAPDLVLDSAPPIAAILAVASVQPDAALPMLAAIQRSHYQEGKYVVRTEVLQAAAESIGIDGPQFVSAFERCLRGKVAEHVQTTRTLMAQLGASGFPTFALEHNGRLTRLPHENYYGKPGLFVDEVASRLV